MISFIRRLNTIIIMRRVNFYPSKGDMNKMTDENKGLKADIKGVGMEDPPQIQGKYVCPTTILR
jgi:hypothetical protein